MPPFHLSAFAPGWLKHSAAVTKPVRRFLQIRTQGLEKVIFTATTGRSGTMTLSTLFATIPRCASLHEPHPIMNESVLAAASYGDSAFVERAYRIKSINILRAALGHRYYMEANHLFAKTFIGHAVEEFGDRMAVIHLVRSPVDVAMSIYCLQHLPGTDYGNSWWLDHRAPTNLIQIAALLESDPQFSHGLYRGLWYWYECELRFAAWRARLPALKVSRFDTAWFNDKQKVFELLDGLEIAYEKSMVESIVGQREHTKSEMKILPALPFSEAEEMHGRFQQLLRARGFDLSKIRYRSNSVA